MKMELDRDDKIFLGSCLTAYLLVMAIVGIYEPSSFVPLLIQSVLMGIIAFLVSYIVA